METEQNSANEISWTWADQISSYRFWGLCLFFVFLSFPNSIFALVISFYYKELGIPINSIAILHLVKILASLGGFWLAWFMVRMKNHKLLYLFSSLTIIGLLLVYFIPSMITISTYSFLLGLSLGAIVLSIPSLIIGGRGGSEMFIVSFGIMTFFEVLSPNLSYLLSPIIEGNKCYILISLGSVILGSVLLLPINKNLFNTNPPKREFAFTPKFRDPTQVALLGLIPFFNIFYIIYLAYRYHGEVNSINPSQKILSPRAAAWCIFLIPIFYPVIMSSLNSSLIPKLLTNNPIKFYKTWVVILWAFLLLPISFALIQSNVNKLINSEVK
jgi:hypothetical protein